MRLVRRKETVASPYSGMDGVLGSTKPDAINLGRPLDPFTRQIGPKLMYGGGLHCMVFGPNGSGKSTRFLGVNALGLERVSTAWVDTKGEIGAISAKFRRRVGKVVVLNPFRVLCDVPGYEDLKSDGFNPLLSLDARSDSFGTDLDIQADSHVTISDGNGRFFDSSAKNLIALCIGVEIIQAHQQRRVPSYRYVRQNICQAMDQSHLELLVSAALESGIWGLQNKALQFKSDKMRNSTADIVSTAIDQTSGLDDLRILHDLETGTFDMREMKEHPVSLYIILPPKQLVRHVKWLRLILSSALDAVMYDRKPGQPRVVFNIDEFYAVCSGGMKIIEDNWSLLRGYGVQMVGLLQGMDQLKARFPKTFENFMAQCGAVICFGARDMVTAEWFAKRAGDKTELIESHTQNDSFSSGPSGASSSSSYSTSWNQTKVPFIPAHKLYEMREGTAYLWMAGLSETAALYVPAYHQVDTLKARARDNPYHTGEQPPAAPIAPLPPPMPRFNGGGSEAMPHDPMTMLRQLGLV